MCLSLTLVWPWLISTNPASGTDPGRNGRIAFIASVDGRIHTINPDGSQQQAVIGGEYMTHCVWGPKGHRIAYVAVAGTVGDGTGTGIFTVQPDGRHRKVLVPASVQTDNRRDASQPTWAPGGQRIAFTWMVFPHNGVPSTRMAVVNRDGSGIHLVPNTVGAYSPAWSPDGSHIAFLRGYPLADAGIYEIRPDGSGLKLLHPGVYGESFPHLDWAPGGHRLAFSSMPQSYSSDIYILHVRTGRLVNLTHSYEKNESSPSWSPNGKKIVFTGNPTDVPGAEIWIMNADGSNRRKVTDVWPGRSPTWQPIVH